MPHSYQLAYRVDAVANDLKYFAGRGKAWNVPVGAGRLFRSAKDPDRGYLQP